MLKMLCGLSSIVFKSFYSNIDIDKQFNFFLAPDDMAYQYLSKGVQNIVIPEISFLHDQSIKTKYSLPKILNW